MTAKCLKSPELSVSTGVEAINQCLSIFFSATAANGTKIARFFLRAGKSRANAHSISKVPSSSFVSCLPHKLMTKMTHDGASNRHKKTKNQRSLLGLLSASKPVYLREHSPPHDQDKDDTHHPSPGTQKNHKYRTTGTQDSHQ